MYKGITKERVPRKLDRNVQLKDTSRFHQEEMLTDIRDKTCTFTRQVVNTLLDLLKKHTVGFYIPCHHSL
jgi:hypothetical protein